MLKIVQPLAAPVDAGRRGGYAVGPQFRSPGYDGMQEPRLADVLSDPVVQRLMASDGVRTEDLLAVLAKARIGLEARPLA